MQYQLTTFSDEMKLKMSCKNPQLITFLLKIKMYSKINLSWIKYYKKMSDMATNPHHHHLPPKKKNNIHIQQNEQTE